MAREGGGEQPSAPDSGATEAAWRQAAAAERSAYGRFCERLRHPSARPVVHRMHRFVTEFGAGRPILEAADEVHRFQDRAAAWMLSKAVVFAADADEEGTREAEEGLEKFLLCRLYPKLFAADPADREADAFLSKHLSGLSWIELQHLGIPSVEMTLFPAAIQELRSIHEYRAPKDKLVCILNACNVINDILKATHEGLGDGKVRALSADDFLPLLIFLVIRANPAHLHSNAEFVASLRHPARMSGEDAYFATAFCSAKEFLANSGPSAFEVAPEEYAVRYAQGVAAAEASAERFWRGAEARAQRLWQGAASEGQPAAAGRPGAGDRAGPEPSDPTGPGTEGGGRPGDPSPPGDSVLAAAPAGGQHPAEQSRAASAAAPPGDLAPGGGSRDDFGSVEAWAEPARPPQPRAQRAGSPPELLPEAVSDKRLVDAWTTVC